MNKKKEIPTVDIHEADGNLDRLIDEAEHGRPFTISSDGKPLVRVSHMGKRELDELPKAAEDEPAQGPDRK